MRFSAFISWLLCLNRLLMAGWIFFALDSIKIMRNNLRCLLWSSLRITYFLRKLIVSQLFHAIH